MQLFLVQIFTFLLQFSCSVLLSYQSVMSFWSYGLPDRFSALTWSELHGPPYPDILGILYSIGSQPFKKELGKQGKNK